MNLRNAPVRLAMLAVLAVGWYWWRYGAHGPRIAAAVRWFDSWRTIPDGTAAAIAAGLIVAYAAAITWVTYNPYRRHRPYSRYLEQATFAFVVVLLGLLTIVLGIGWYLRSHAMILLVAWCTVFPIVLLIVGGVMEGYTALRKRRNA